MTKRDTLRSRAEGRDSIQKTDPKGSFQISSGSQRSALPQVVSDLLQLLIAQSGGGMPTPERIALRDLSAKLQRAYPFLRLNEVELAQELAEYDEEPIDDAP